jgi:hypothetical protein
MQQGSALEVEFSTANNKALSHTELPGTSQSIPS